MGGKDPVAVTKPCGGDAADSADSRARAQFAAGAVTATGS
jgi:hypothetical protein